LCDNVRARLRQDEHATLTLIRYRTNGELTFAGAHEDLLLLRRDSDHCMRVPTTGIWAGIVKHAEGAALVQGELQLIRGDPVLLYTDGITEARNEQRELFGVERLGALLEKHRNLSAEAIRCAVVNEVERWSRHQDDDRTLVVIRYHGPSEV
jgi:serine phosphatase RsbU (regulator of sigma subunit)